jgi:hypothetical protein
VLCRSRKERASWNVVMLSALRRHPEVLASSASLEG